MPSKQMDESVHQVGAPADCDSMLFTVRAGLVLFWACDRPAADKTFSTGSSNRLPYLAADPGGVRGHEDAAGGAAQSH